MRAQVRTLQAFGAGEPRAITSFGGGGGDLEAHIHRTHAPSVDSALPQQQQQQQQQQGKPEDGVVAVPERRSFLTR